MKRQYISLLVLFLLAICPVTGICAETPPPQVDEDARFSALVQRAWDSFTGFSKADFALIVSDDFVPDKEEFLDSVESFFYSEKPLDLSFSIDKVVSSEGKAIVSFSWNRNTADRKTGQVIAKKGKGAIVFAREGGGWLIYRIEGDSIFSP